MNERIGTFCEKCREVVCRCAEYRNTEELVKRAFKVQPIYEINPEFAEIFKEPYGWCIEHNVNTFYTGKDRVGKWTGFSGWDRQWKHKTYKTREIALEAITQMSKGDGEYVQIKYRIFPVYQGKIEEV